MNEQEAALARYLDAEYEKLDAVHRRSAPTSGTVPVGGGEWMDSFFRMEAIRGCVAALTIGHTIDEAVDLGKKASREAVKMWNSRRKGEYEIHRWEETAYSFLDAKVIQFRSRQRAEEKRKNMEIYSASNFQAVLEKRRDDFPQAIVAGWMMPDGRHTGAAAQVCDKTPTEGELAIAYAACLAACFAKLGELLDGASPENRENLLKVIDMMTAGMEVAARFKSGLCSAEAMAGAPE